LEGSWKGRGTFFLRDIICFADDIAMYATHADVTELGKGLGAWGAEVVAQLRKDGIEVSEGKTTAYLFNGAKDKKGSIPDRIKVGPFPDAFQDEPFTMVGGTFALNLSPKPHLVSVCADVDKILTKLEHLAEIGMHPVALRDLRARHVAHDVCGERDVQPRLERGPTGPDQTTNDRRSQQEAAAVHP
jgi:hypothetical protein